MVRVIFIFYIPAIQNYIIYYFIYDKKLRYAKSAGGVWYRYDDNLVKEIKDVQLASEFAYMLFYERRKSEK